MFIIIFVDTFENIRCFPFRLSFDKRKVVIFMTKREFPLFIIILHLIDHNQMYPFLFYASFLDTFMIT